MNAVLKPNAATHEKVVRVVEMMNSLGAVKDGGFCGSRGRVVHVTSKGPVAITAKIWREYDNSSYASYYKVLFSLECDPGATETQIIDATKRLLKVQQTCPTFTADDLLDTDAAFDLVLG